jgi:hypothetical protein
VPIYALGVPDFSYSFSQDRFVYRGSLTAAAMFERGRGILPIPTGTFEVDLWRDNPVPVARPARGVLDPPVGPGRWFPIPPATASPNVLGHHRTHARFVALPHFRLVEHCGCCGGQ